MPQKKIVFLGLSAWLAWAGWAVPARSQSLEKGEEILAKGCTLCHGLGYVTDSHRSRSEWEDLVTDMAARGAPLLKGEFEIMMDYLVRNYGPDKALQKSKPDATSTKEN